MKSRSRQRWLTSRFCFLATETARWHCGASTKSFNGRGGEDKEVEEEEVCCCSYVCVFNNLYSTRLITLMKTMKPDGKVRCIKPKPEKEHSSADTDDHSNFPSWVFYIGHKKKKSRAVFVFFEVTRNKTWCLILNPVLILESTDEQ